MPNNADRGEDNDVKGLLRDIRGEQSRQSTDIQEIKRCVLGEPHDPTGGLAFRVAQQEADAKARDQVAARRDNIVTGLIVAVGAALILAVAPLIFRTLSSLPIGG